MTGMAASAAALRPQAPVSPLAALRRMFGGFKILLPFCLLVALWWAIHAGGDFPDNVLVSPLAAWRAFVHLVTHGVLAEYASTSLRLIGIAALFAEEGAQQPARAL